MDKTKFLPMQNKHEWIRSVRGEMSKVEFGKCICHYRKKGQIEECRPYHRNVIGNWEDGNDFPKEIEGFLSIALLEFDKKFEKEEITIEDRNARYEHANARMFEAFGKYLYARNLREVLLISIEV